MVPVMVFLIFPRFCEIVYIQCSIYFNSNFICLISVIFFRDVTIGIRAKVLKIFLKYFGASGE